VQYIEQSAVEQTESDKRRTSRQISTDADIFPTLHNYITAILRWAEERDINFHHIQKSNFVLEIKSYVMKLCNAKVKGFRK
jgi:hypothetical protein